MATVAMVSAETLKGVYTVESENGDYSVVFICLFTAILAILLEKIYGRAISWWRSTTSSPRPCMRSMGVQTELSNELCLDLQYRNSQRLEELARVHAQCDELRQISSIPCSTWTRPTSSPSTRSLPTSDRIFVTKTGQCYHRYEGCPALKGHSTRAMRLCERCNP
eukprot:Skav228977  [mRNA]  locus=scaffold671:256042:256536:- [translate_table: standard]